MGRFTFIEYTEDIEKKIEARLKRAGFVIGIGGWADTISLLHFNGDKKNYRRALFILCRCIGIKPTMKESRAWGYSG